MVGVVLCNKYIITQGFSYTMILGACHFAFTWLGCQVMLRLGHFKYKPAALKNLLPVSIVRSLRTNHHLAPSATRKVRNRPANGPSLPLTPATLPNPYRHTQGSLGSVAFMNLNLAYNSVGFYQLSKLMCIPFTIAVQRLVFRQEASRAVKLTLVPILLGVGLATVHDVSVNAAGTVFALVAVVFTTFSQIFTQRYQAALECNALQLLYLTSPLICLGMVFLAPFFDNIRDFQGKYMPARLGGLGPDTLPLPLPLGDADADADGHRLLGRDDDGAMLGAGAGAEGGGGLAVWILLSCVLALGVNISNYLVLGKTSPLTYQVLGACLLLCFFLGLLLCMSRLSVGLCVWLGQTSTVIRLNPPTPHPPAHPQLGHLKTVLILVLGVVLFHSAVDLRQTLGILIAMGGVVCYTEVKRRQAQRPASKLPR